MISNFARVRAGALNLTARLIISRNPRAAVRLIERAMAYSPHDSSLYGSLYRAYWRLGRREKAVNSFEMGADLQPQNLAYRWTFGLLLLKTGRYRRALKEFEYCVASWVPTESGYLIPNAYPFVAMCLINMEGDLVRAETLLGESARAVPWNLDMLFAKQSLYYVTDRLDQIPELLGNYMDAYPGYYPVEFSMGHYEQYFHYDIEASLDWYGRALRSWENKGKREYCKNFVTVDWVFGSLLDEYMEALIAAQKLHEAWSLVQRKESWSEHKDVQKEREIRYYLLTKDFERAEKVAKQALENQHLKNPVIVSLLANALGKQRKYETALSNLTTAMSLDDECGEALDTLGNIQLEMKDWTAAAKTFERLLSLTPYASGWLEMLGKCHKNLGQLEAARSTYEKAVKLDPFCAEAWRELGEVYSLLGQADLAHSASERATELGRITLKKSKTTGST